MVLCTSEVTAYDIDDIEILDNDIKYNVVIMSL